MNILRRYIFQRKLLIINATIPLAALCFDWFGGKLGANPPEVFIRTTGVMAILFLVLTLAVSPLVRGPKWRWLMPHRRALGLAAFGYALIHMLSYAVFDKSGRFSEIVTDISKRPFILLGFTAFFLMIPLAATSNTAALRKLGIKRWQKLHKLTYFIAVCAAVHYWMIVKSDVFYPGLFAIAVAVLLLFRLPIKRLVAPFFLFACLTDGHAQAADHPKLWTDQIPPFHIAGPIFYVGTKGLGVYLIKTNAGLILLSGGLPHSEQLISSSIRKLGFKLEDIQQLLITHAHIDHVGTLAAFKKMTRAPLAVMDYDSE